MNITETGGDEQHQRPTAVLEGTEISDSVARALALGWSVIPCRRDKRPCLSWRKFQKVRATEEEIRSWQATYNPSAWAVIAGQVSGVVVLDFDGEAGNRTRTALRLTPHVKTGSGGSHVYVDHPGWSTRTVNGKSKTILGELRHGRGRVELKGRLAAQAARKANPSCAVFILSLGCL